MTFIEISSLGPLEVQAGGEGEPEGSFSRLTSTSNLFKSTAVTRVRGHRGEGGCVSWGIVILASKLSRKNN